MAASAAAPSSVPLKDYLKRYQSGNEDDIKKKKKKKKPSKSNAASSSSVAGGVLVVDEDPVWQKPVKIEADDESSSDGDNPQVDEDIEVKRMRRLEMIRLRRPYNAISEDGSGWVTVNDDAKPSSTVDADLSPPRQRRFESPSPDPGQDDLSPPRRTRHRSSEVDTPPKTVDGDLSPPRRSRPPRVTSASGDLSPPRRSRGGGPVDSREDLSPPRKARRGSSPKKEIKRAGLFTGKEIKKDIDMKRREDNKWFAQMDPSLSGRGAEPVYRDKKGNRITKDEFLKSQKKEEKPKEIKLEWGKGLVQKKQAEARAMELELEKDKPFALTRDDPDRDRELKERIRFGDPMAHLVKRKQPLILEDLGDDEKMRESGFKIPQGVPNHSWIKRGVDPPPNRYGIRPGRHWDGVDRSTGFEKEMFKRQNEKRATEREAYLWSVSDM
ncbi:hypothetical protein QJS10_CPA01g02875 [Acorus calamus]|uniref:BUD13 homolog n=1 Tax=Acorus calamus TaxID=4465 RepID=A0AAV9FLC6_ACOCL|nr:hypothetical protein QJS10_CPA01g02875 [Acorus calamus]